MTDELRKQIRAAAEILKAFGAREVYVFGSAAGGTLRDDSDIDMAVSGLPAEVFFKAWARAVRAFSGREMDLVDLDQGGVFAEFLRNKGKLHHVA